MRTGRIELGMIAGAVAAVLIVGLTGVGGWVLFVVTAILATATIDVACRILADGSYQGVDPDTAPTVHSPITPMVAEITVLRRNDQAA